MAQILFSHPSSRTQSIRLVDSVIFQYRCTDARAFSLLLVNELCADTQTHTMPELYENGAQHA